MPATSADIEAWHAFSPGIRPIRRRNDAAVTFG
jgi:hypothetical protein